MATIQLVDLAHARSGDKGDTANVGVLVYDPRDYDLLRETLTVERVKAHFGERVKGEVERFELPNLNALNFLLHGALGGGLRFDEVRVELVGWGSTHGHLAGPPPADHPEVELRVAVRSQDRESVERFSRELAPLVLTGPPSVTGFAGGRPRVQQIMAYWPALLRKEAVQPNLTVDVREV